MVAVPAKNRLAAGTGLEEAAADGFDHVGP